MVKFGFVSLGDFGVFFVCWFGLVGFLIDGFIFSQKYYNL